MAISGSTIVVGSYCHSATPSINCEGAAYVFTGSGSHWSPVAELDDPGASADDYFGWDVAATSASTILVKRHRRELECGCRLRLRLQ